MTDTHRVTHLTACRHGVFPTVLLLRVCCASTMSSSWALCTVTMAQLAGVVSHSVSLKTLSQGSTLGPHHSCLASAEQGEGAKQPLVLQQPLQLWVRILASNPGYIFSPVKLLCSQIQTKVFNYSRLWATGWHIILFLAQTYLECYCSNLWFLGNWTY